MDSLSEDLIRHVLEYSTCISLAKLALTNETWASRSALMLQLFWSRSAQAQQRWHLARTDDDLDQFIAWASDRRIAVLMPACMIVPSQLEDFSVYEEDYAPRQWLPGGMIVIRDTTRLHTVLHSVLHSV